MTLADILTAEEIEACIRIWNECWPYHGQFAADRIHAEIIEPNMGRIRLVTDRPASFLVMCVEHVLDRAAHEKS